MTAPAQPSLPPSLSDARTAIAARRVDDAPDEPVNVATVWRNLKDFPWRNTLDTLKQRFKEDDLNDTAGSLTFSTMLAVVPFFTVALAVFTAFPMFSKVQVALQKWFVDSLIPTSIAETVLNTMTQFAGNASKMGAVGFLGLIYSAMMLVLTMDRKLNNIWRVRQPHPFIQKVLIYWAMLTLGPLLLGGSLVLTSYAVSASRGLVVLPGGIKFALGTLETVLGIGAVAALYKYVPNTSVKWRHALVGALFVSVSLALAQKLLGLYLTKAPSYSVIYGAFAALPIFLIWVYLSWLIFLFGAVIAAYLPSLLRGVPRRTGTRGFEFEVAMETLRDLVAARQAGVHGLSLDALARKLKVDTLQLTPVLETLVALDWVGRLQPRNTGESERFTLLVDTAATPLKPLMDALLLRPSTSTQPIYEAPALHQATLQEVL